MRRCLLLLSLLLGLCALTACDKPAPPQWHWQMLSAWPAQSPEFIAAQRLAGQINSMSNARLQISVQAATEPAQVLAALSSGSSEAAYGSAASWQAAGRSAAFSNALGFDLSAQQLTVWLSQGGGQALWDEAYQDLGIKPLAVGSSRAMGGWSNVEIKQLADLNGLKVASASPALWRRLGATSERSVTQRLDDLRSGALDASDANPAADTHTLSRGPVASYYYPDWPTAPAPIELLINQHAFASLPADLQAIVLQASQAANQDSLARASLAHAIAVEQLQHIGSQVKQLPAEVRAALQQQSILLQGEHARQSEFNGRIWASLQALQALFNSAAAPNALPSGG